jgi:hypothetical protein
MRLFIFALFWVGVFTVVREWRYSRKHGVTITRAEKIYLTTALPLIFGAELVLELVGVAPHLAMTGSAIAIGLALNGWGITRRLRRALSS